MEGLLPAATWFQSSPLAETLFHESGDALLVVDPLSERILDANPAAVRLSEFSREELQRSSIRSLLRHEQDWQDWLAPAQEKAVRSAEGFLLRTRRPEAWTPVSLTISKLHAAHGSGTLFALRDRREQIEAHHRLQAVEAELGRVLASVRDCLWSCRVEPEGRWRYHYLSPAAERLTGRPVGLFLQDPSAWQQAVDPEDLPRWQAFIQRLTAGGSGELEYRLRRPDGGRLWVRERVVAVACPSQGGLLLHGVLGEIAEHRDAGAPPADRHEPQRRKLESMAVLAAATAHDFNNLLTGVLGHVSLARVAAGPVAHPALSALDEIEKITLRAADLCRRLTTFAGRTGGQGGVCDLNAVAREGVALKQTALPDRVQVRLSLADSLPAVSVDAGLVRQALLCLLDNAVEAVEPEGGVVEVRTAVGTIADADACCFDYRSAELASAGTLVSLEVHNDGSALAPEVEARLFEPFFSTRTGRRGLGLSSVLGVARGCKGGVQVQSAADQGTAFRLVFSGQTTPAAPVRPSAVAARGTVLLADDEETVLDVAARLLAAAGCNVLRARDGEAARTLFQQHAGTIHLALIDLTMPRMSGEAVLRELRRLAPALPLVLMSGYPAGEILPRFNDLHLAGYLQKPFRLPTLLELLQQVLPAKG